MNKIQELFMCPECKCGLSESLECNKCGNKFSYKHGVYDGILQKMSSSQEILWDITEEMIEEDIKSSKEKQNDIIKDYNSYKNEETIEAQKLMDVRMQELVEDLSGTVCDLATGMGSMLQRLLNAKNKDFNIVCTDIDKRILMSTKNIKSTIVAEAIWAENPYDLLPVAGDNERYCIIQAEC